MPLYRAVRGKAREITMAKQKNANTETHQIDRFIETARALGCDEDRAAFDEKLKAIVRHKPKPIPHKDQDRG